MRVTFDSNAWEAIFSAGNTSWEPIQTALRSGQIEGFICAVSFGIEAITKQSRSMYFAQPHMDVSFDIVSLGQPGDFTLVGSIGPDHAKHPGIPPVQAEKLRRALESGVKLIQGQNWMGLPVAVDLLHGDHYVSEDRETVSGRENRQNVAAVAIEQRGVGKAAFDAVDGWTNRPRKPAEERELVRACAEWADGELVAAHIAYGHDILCTNDRARSTGASVFDISNRAWVAVTYGVRCMTLGELAERVST